MLFALLGVAAVIVIAVLALLARGGAGPAAFPAPVATPVSPVSFEDFTGADACAGCHPDETRVWRTSTHGLAGGEPPDVPLLQGFDGTPIRFVDATVTPTTGANGEHSFVVSREGRPDQRLAVDGVVGGGHMIGGGTQGYLTRLDDGTLRFLPFERVRDENVWFCNTNTRLDSGWLPITRERRLADCGDWPPVRVFGNIPRFANCQECHGSQIEVAAEPGRPDATRFRSLAIDCEACHGPGRIHVERMNADSPSGADIGVVALATLPKDSSVVVCMRCHALKDGLDRGWLAGADFERHYSVMLPLLSESPVWPDGRIRTFAYQQGHLWSDCYVSGSMTCTDCHDPHAQSYRDANGLPIAGRFADAQCTSCHPSKAVDPPAHTKHAAGSAGSRCVSCHMPFLQEPEVGEALRYARSDHTIPVPRPAADAAMGIVSACETCHRDRDVADLDRQTALWWGALKPRPRAVDALFDLERGDAGGLDRALAAAAGERHTPARVMALNALLATRLRPDMVTLDPAYEAALLDATESRDPDVQALGLAGLHLARGNDAEIRRFLIRSISTLGARAPAVRARWTLILGSIGDELRQSGNLEESLVVYGKALEIDPDNAGVFLNRGFARSMGGDADGAEADYLRAIEFDSLAVLPWVNLGISRAARGDARGALAAYQQASRIDPFDPLPWFNLGNLFFRADRNEDAIEAYRRAVRYSPGLAAAQFNLARALIVAGRIAEARTALLAGLDFQPDEPTARQALSQIDSMLAAVAERR